MYDKPLLQKLCHEFKLVISPEVKILLENKSVFQVFTDIVHLAGVLPFSGLGALQELGLGHSKNTKNSIFQKHKKRFILTCF